MAGVYHLVIICALCRKKLIPKIFSFNFVMCFSLCISILVGYFFYNADCYYTTFIFNPFNPNTFRHRFPLELPYHLFSNTTFSDHVKKNVVNQLSSPVPPIVHFVWCSHGHFQFQHYLGVLSSLMFLKPTVIYFHYVDKLPFLDKDGYYQFFMDLKRDIPVFIVDTVNSDACSVFVNTRLHFIFHLLNKDGGIFMGDSVVITQAISTERDFLIALGRENSIDLVLMKKGFLETANFTLLSIPQFLLSLKAFIIECVKCCSLPVANIPCVVAYEEIFPVLVWEMKNDFGRLARSLVYGKSETLKAKRGHTLIPNIVHYVSLGNNKMKYFSYLSMLSALYILNADMVYVHGDREPHGLYWAKLKNHQRVIFIKREFPGAVFSEPIVKYASHASDYLRADLLIRYGGVYMDWDVIWVNPISELRNYETVICPDFPHTGAFPDVFNFGVLLAASGSQYLRFFLESYHHYLDDHWSYNAIHMPYKVYEKHPDLVHVDRHLQVRLCAV